MMDNKKIIVGESNCYSIGRNYNKMAMLQEIMAENEPIVLDKNDEYKNICQELNIECVKECNSTN